MGSTVSSPPGGHSWSDLLQMVGRIRGLAFAKGLPPMEALGQIRDEFRLWDGEVEP